VKNSQDNLAALRAVSRSSARPLVSSSTWDYAADSVLCNGLADTRGINVRAGADGANRSDNLNVFEAMRTGSLVSKARTPDLDR